MDATRLRACLDALAWTGRGVAALLGVDERQVRRWAAGATIPPRIAAWLEMATLELAPRQRRIAELQRKIADWMAANPPPEK